jgi:hypothetical protein
MGNGGLPGVVMMLQRVAKQAQLLFLEHHARYSAPIRQVDFH